MITLLHRENCCGCAACEQVCPKRCITLKADSEGFWYPKVNAQICINCNLLLGRGWGNREILNRIVLYSPVFLKI